MQETTFVRKSANQMWKESGTTLSFKEWIELNKQRYLSFTADGKSQPLIYNKPLNDSIQTTMNEIRKMAGYKTEASNKTVLGLNSTVLIISGLIVVAAVAYVTLKKKK